MISNLKGTLIQSIYTDVSCVGSMLLSVGGKQ